MSESFPTGGIHRYVQRYIESLPALDGKVVVDIPCGDGRASHLFRRKGASLRALDLFPQFMRAEGVQAEYADMTETLPVEDGVADIAICQEGIEHVPDPLFLLGELNRVLRPGGRLLLTTPNMSQLRARLSYFLLETDLWKRLPPTGIDSIWFAEGQSEKLYFGHLFLIGAHRLRTLTRLAGFDLVERVPNKRSGTAMFLTVFAYPWLAAATFLAYRQYRKRNPHVPRAERERIFREHVELNLASDVLCGKNLFWVLEKQRSVAETTRALHRWSRPASSGAPADGRMAP